MNVEEVIAGSRAIEAAFKRSTRREGEYEREAQPVFTVKFRVQVFDLSGRCINEGEFHRRFYSPGEARDFQDSLPRPSVLRCEDRDAAHRLNPAAAAVHG